MVALVILVMVVENKKVLVMIIVVSYVTELNFIRKSIIRIYGFKTPC